MLSVFHRMGVTKGDIVSAVTGGCDTFEAIQKETGCATGCGGCGSVAKQIFSFVSGAELVSKETLCDCTSHSTAEVREYIRALDVVKTIDEIRSALDFTSTCDEPSILISPNNKVLRILLMSVSFLIKSK
jgi:nitrite reductase (NADH) large subunit